MCYPSVRTGFLHQHLVSQHVRMIDGESGGREIRKCPHYWSPHWVWLEYASKRLARNMELIIKTWQGNRCCLLWRLSLHIQHNGKGSDNKTERIPARNIVCWHFYDLRCLQNTEMAFCLLSMRSLISHAQLSLLPLGVRKDDIFSFPDKPSDSSQVQKANKLHKKIFCIY